MSGLAVADVSAMPAATYRADQLAGYLRASRTAAARTIGANATVGPSASPGSDPSPGRYLARSTGPATAVATVQPGDARAVIGAPTAPATPVAATFGTTLTGALDQYANGTSPGPTALPVATVVGQPAPSQAGTAVTGDSVVADARRYLGVPYVWGGESPQGLDCSGLVQLTFHDLGISLPRVAADQARQGTEIASLAQAQPGDLLAFGDPAHHIAIYLGHNKLLEAPEPGKSVHVTDVYRTPTTIRRIVPAGTDSPAPANSTQLAGGVGTIAPVPAVPRAVPLSTIAIIGSFDSGSMADVPRASDANARAPMAAHAGGRSAVGNVQTVGRPTGLTAAQLKSAGLSDAVAGFADAFADAEAKFSLPRGLLAAVAQQESSGDAGAISPVGAQGLMQLMPSTARALGVDDPFDPRQAIPGAARLLADNLKQFGGSVPLALAAYNAGPAAVVKYGGVPPYRETQQYVRSVTGMLARLP